MAIPRISIMTFPAELAAPVKYVSWVTLEGDVSATGELLGFIVVIDFDALFSKCNSV